MTVVWVEDDLPFGSYDDNQQQGSAWSSSGGEATYPEIRRPIGFMRDKPIVRVKAWTRPIPKAE